MKGYYRDHFVLNVKSFELVTAKRKQAAKNILNKKRFRQKQKRNVYKGTCSSQRSSHDVFTREVRFILLHLSRKNYYLVAFVPLN